jgi:hypothetical protein
VLLIMPSSMVLRGETFTAGVMLDNESDLCHFM